MSEITKHALEDSLKVLLLRKPFNKITIVISQKNVVLTV